MQKIRSFACAIACGTILFVGAGNPLLAGGASPPAAAIGQVTFVGALRAESGSFFLTDETSKVSIEVRGKKLKKFAGKRVSLTGSLVAGSAGSQVLMLSTITAAKAGAIVGATAAATTTGLTAGTVAAASSAAAVAGTVGGLYAADVIGGSDNNVSR